MEYITITEEAKYAVAAICKEAMVTEYDMILNYPRIVEYIVNIEHIKDNQLVDDLEKLGKESLGHFSVMDRLIRDLGSEPAWLINPLQTLADVDYFLEKQLEKEKTARGLYEEARKVTAINKTTVKIGGIFDLFRGKDTREENIIPFEQIIHHLDRTISDETRHIRIAEDSLATHKALLNR